MVYNFFATLTQVGLLFAEEFKMKKLLDIHITNRVFQATKFLPPGMFFEDSW